MKYSEFADESDPRVQFAVRLLAAMVDDRIISPATYRKTIYAYFPESSAAKELYYFKTVQSLRERLHAERRRLWNKIINPKPVHQRRTKNDWQQDELIRFSSCSCDGNDRYLVRTSDHDVLGPYERCIIKDMILCGQISKRTNLWTEGLSGWAKAEDIACLADYFDMQKEGLAAERVQEALNIIKHDIQRVENSKYDNIYKENRLRSLKRLSEEISPNEI